MWSKSTVVLYFLANILLLHVPIHFLVAILCKFSHSEFTTFEQILDEVGLETRVILEEHEHLFDVVFGRC